jgi:DNA-3-methyladenine glycosylase I
MTERCAWAKSPPMIEYHDTEWGLPVHQDNRWFEFMVLNAFQAGLTWELILKRRPFFRSAFAGFDPQLVAAFGQPDRERLLADPNIIRNRLKIDAAIHNARVFQQVQLEYGCFDHYVWNFINGQVIHNHWSTLESIPAVSDESRAISQALIKRGFKFVGPTICYAMMQAAGMVNDHLISCFRHAELIECSVP